LDSHYKVSVITAVLNGAETLSGTIESVAGQDYPNLEYIIVDGGSSDGTLDLLARHGDVIDRCISGPDSGIADAMNKGLRAASGDLLLFLHADDRFLDGSALSSAMARVDSLDAIWAFDILFGEGGRQTRCSARPFNAWTRFKNPLPHQGVLCPRRVFDRLGGFDTTLRIDMDYDLWLRAYLADIPLRRIRQVLAVMGSGGISSRRDWAGLSRRFAEERRVQMAHAAGTAWAALYALYWPVYLGYRRLRAACGI
jgi:glycosyltransferase involved in cell wall biosynthesis